MSPARRIRAAIGRTPRPLGLLLVVVAVLGVTWALVEPWLQAPDEQVHYAYAESLATRFALPLGHTRPPFSTDQNAAGYASAAGRTAEFSFEAKGSWDPHTFSAYRTAAPHLSRSDGGGENSATPNPPLYYLYADLAYWAAGGNAFDRLYAMRLLTVLLLLATAIGAWLLAGEVLGRNRPAQLVCAALVGLAPMQTFISSMVNPDSLMITLWTFALWLGARVICRGLFRRDGIALGAVTAAAILTKATSYALLPATLGAFAVGWVRAQPAGALPWRRAPRDLALPLAALFVPVLGWLGIAAATGRSAVNTLQTPAGVRRLPFVPRQFLSYVWQFYLPRLPGMHPVRPGFGLWTVWIKQFWGQFAWLDVMQPGWVYTAGAVFLGALAAGGIMILATIRDRVRIALVCFFALAAGALLFGLNLTEYRSIIAGQGIILQGRYLLPAIGLFGLAGGLVYTRLPVRFRAGACGLVLASLLALQVLSLARVVDVFYT